MSLDKFGCFERSSPPLHLWCVAKGAIQKDMPYICVSILYWCLSFWLTSLCIMGSSFIHLIRTDGNDNPICKTEKETQMYRTDFWTLWEKARMGWSERIALKHVYYHLWNGSPGLMPGTGCSGLVHWDDPAGMGWGERWEGGSGWWTHVNPWLIHVSVWQKPIQYCKVISLQII